MPVTESDSEEELPTLNQLFDRLVAATAARKQAQQQVTTTSTPSARDSPTSIATSPKSINVVRAAPAPQPRPPATPTTPHRDQQQVERRRSPRLASTSPTTTKTPAPPSPLKKVANKVTSNDPDSAARHRALADELFPPSPPSQAASVLSPLTNRQEELERSRERSPSVISDSEPDLPSPVKPSVGKKRSEVELAKVRRRRRSREGTYISDSEEERVQEENAWRQRTTAPAAKPRAARAASVFDLDSDDDDLLVMTPRHQEMGLSLDALTISDPRPPPQLPPVSSTTIPKVTRTPKSARRRRITISIASSSSDSDVPAPPPFPRSSKATKDVEIITIDDREDEEDEGARATEQNNDLVVTLPSMSSGGGTPVARRSLTPEQEDDFDPNAGTLVYDPTPRARKPVKLHPGASPKASPSRSPTKAKKVLGKSKMSNEIDLTGSSDSDIEVTTPSLPRPAPPSFLPSSSKPGPSTPRPRPKQPSSSTTTPARTPKPKAKPTETRATLLTPADRESLPLALIRQLDRQVFHKRWEGLRCLDGEDEFNGDGLPDGMGIVWNNKLRNTAGRANWKSVKSGGVTTHHTTIELATKVTDTQEKLRHTLAHELCHVAAWALSREMKPPHGPAFKLWANRIMKVRPDIQITTTHTYTIVYKFRWRCIDDMCGKVFQRHSKSIDPTTQGCPCGSRIVQIDAEGKEKVQRATPAKKSDWQEFLSVTAPLVRAEVPGIKSEDVFKVVAERYKVAKARAIEADERMLEAMGMLKV